MTSLAGFSFVFEGRSASEAESSFVRSGNTVPNRDRDFVVRIEDLGPSERSEFERVPAEAVQIGKILHVKHPCFRGEIHLANHVGVLRRAVGDSYALHLFCRVAVSFLIAEAGGIPLHSAAVLSSSSAILFFGRSGAGKSTISSMLQLPVLSDELVAVFDAAASATGFWGSYDPSLRTDITGRYPIVGAVELQHGRSFHLEQLEPADAIRRLLPVTLTPPVDHLWQQTMSALADFCSAVPVYRMQWSLDQNPWPELAAKVGIKT